MGYPTDEDFAKAHGWNPDRPRFSEADRKAKEHFDAEGKANHEGANLPLMGTAPADRLVEEQRGQTFPRQPTVEHAPRASDHGYELEQRQADLRQARANEPPSAGQDYDFIIKTIQAKGKAQTILDMMSLNVYQPNNAEIKEVCTAFLEFFDYAVQKGKEQQS